MAFCLWQCLFFKDGSPQKLLHCTPRTLQILSINDWNREEEKCIPLSFRCDGRSNHDGADDDSDDGADDDSDDGAEDGKALQCLFSHHCMK